MKNIIIFNIKQKNMFKLYSFYFFLFIYIFLLQIDISYSECSRDNPFNKSNICVSSCTDSQLNLGECKIDNSIIKIQWLNNIFLFDSDHFRAGHFAFNSNDDMFIEYSYDKYRLFFGLKNNGKFFFKDNNNNEIPTKIIELEGDDYKRYESKNIFISLKNNTKEYLFSTGEDKTISELYDLDTNKYKTNKTENFFGNTLSSSVFTLLELRYNNFKEYLIAYMYDNNYVIQKFNLTDFILYTSEKINSKPIAINFLNRIASCFIMDSLQIIILFYVDNNYYYSINIYDFNLNILKNNIIISEQINSFNQNHGMFSKCLSIKETLGFFIYFKNMNSYSLQLKIGYIDVDNNYSFSEKFKKDLNNYSFDTTTLLNDLIKINDERFALISISSNDNSIFYIILFDLYNEYTQMKIRVYKSKLYQYKIINELEASLYNNHLSLSFTILKNDDEIPQSTLKYDNYCHSIFFIIGYTNETNNTIDITDYFMDDNVNNEKNIITKLTQNIIIDNNIFGNEVVYDKIKLFSIPDEIIFYNNSENQKLINGNILDQNYTFEVDMDLVRTDKYYILEYQFIIKEPNYEKFNSYTIDIIDCPSSNKSFEDQENYFNQKMYYGKINNVKFKLCLDFCSCCRKYGKTNNAQICQSCLYDSNSVSDSFSNSTFYSISDSASDSVSDYSAISTSNGVSYNDFVEETRLIECNNDNSKFYKNLTNNKIICLNNNLLCPDDYPFLIISTNECKDSCLYKDLLIKECFLPKINHIIYKEILEDIIFSYSYDGESLVIEGEEQYIFQLTTSLNEINTIEGIYANGYNLSMIDLGECENLLKQKYNIDQNVPLIIIKFEKLTNEASEKNVQYEIYHPFNKTKLNLSICKNTHINLYIPITLNEKTQNLYEDLQEYGYDLFNINDSFYQDICTPYKSENGTDVLLSDRKNDFYTNETSCQNNCQYSNYSIELQYLKCECDIDNDDINITRFDEKIIFKSFYEVLKYSNFKVIKCYYLVFNINLISENLGSIILIIFLIIYLFSLFTYIIKGINPLKIHVYKEFIEKEKIKDKIKEKDHNQQYENENLKKKTNNGTFRLKNYKNKYSKKKKIKNNIRININFNKENENPSLSNKFTNSRIIFNYFQKNTNKIKEEKEKLDDFELNELEYLEAIRLDKRAFNQIYWSYLKRNHIILFTFCYRNDCNLSYIKYAKFIFLIGSIMAMNIIFFNDNSMHKIYLDYGKYNFIQHIPKIIYSTIISEILECFLCYLSLTDKHIYEIKRIKNYNNNMSFVFRKFRIIKIKLFSFFLITFILFIFNWYFVSSFCAVYKNTQKIFIKDSISSFTTSVIDQFFFYLIPVILRIIAIKDKKKRLKCLYIISEYI